MIAPVSQGKLAQAPALASSATKTDPKHSSLAPAAFSLELAQQPPAAAPNKTTPPSPPSSLKKLASDIDQQRQAIDRLLAGASAGRTFSPAELLALQARVYAYSQNMEVISSLVDKTLSAVKTTLNTQV